ncbi:glycoside hydrolase family 13 protein [Segatella maculosa]|uniref:glycoside hydrolase family 13 protein n=1 Tax=Segatella maculosa TaxID=439703 RepID=UPI0023F31655|nr:glycoside hydrolase family 13 protein [Segatella maculosa]
MKKTAFVLGLLLVAMMIQAATKIDRIEPANWFVGMKNSSLQLMVYGKNIRNSHVSVDYPGVKVDSLVRLDSPDYLLVYLNISGAKAGDMTISFDGKKVKYPLQAREMSGDKRMGFTNSDVLYMLMPDRFSSGRNLTQPLKGMKPYRVDRSKPDLRHGGDLEGIRQHLDYFTQLGVTALWFTPILENDAPDIDSYNNYHGYDTTDYYRVDPRFGTNEEYRRLIEEAHAKGLKVVMDMIFNHCGFDHPWVKNMPSKDWFNAPEWLKTGGTYLQTSYKLTPVLDPYASEVDKRETVDGWFVKTKPDLNQRNPHVMTYLVQNSIWWIETVGIDGIRMDTYPYADRKAMSQWMKTLNEEYPNFNTVGEIWVTEPAYTAAWQKDSRLSAVNSYLKTVMDFSFYDKINLAKNEETDDWWKGLNRIYNSLCYDYLYEDPSSVMAFIENHDTDRFLGEGKDTLALKQALALLLTINRIPQLYYGTEVLMNGTKTKTDGDVRRDFPGGFAGDTHDAFTAEGRTKAEQSMFDWLSKLLHWRRNNAVISRGRQVQFIPYKGVYVIARQLDNKTVLTILNGKHTPVELPLDRYTEVIGSHQEAKDVITDCKVRLDKTLKLKARETKVLEF